MMEISVNSHWVTNVNGNQCAVKILAVGGDFVIVETNDGKSDAVRISAFRQHFKPRPTTRQVFVNLWWDGDRVKVGNVKHTSLADAEHVARVKAGTSGDLHLLTVGVEIPNA